MSVLPTTSLGYTLGLRRDKNIYGKGERSQANPFEQSRGRTRMAGDRRVDIFTAERPPQLLEYFKNKNKKKEDGSGEKMSDKEKRKEALDKARSKKGKKEEK